MELILTSFVLNQENTDLENIDWKIQAKLENGGLVFRSIRRTLGASRLPAKFLLNSILSKLTPLTITTDSDAKLNTITPMHLRDTRIPHPPELPCCDNRLE
jgi:hypothetical protein